jgi:hypothetical protein
VNVVGPTAVDGPWFVAVSVIEPAVPGVIVGEDAVTATSALRAPAITVVGATVLFAVDGSVVTVATVAEPPVIAPGVVAAASDRGIDTEVEPPFTMSPLTVHVTVPLASVQPAGNVPRVTPAGGA